jgi:hypothetical protein
MLEAVRMKKPTAIVAPSGAVREAKKDDLSPSHLRWLVDSRTSSQNSALKLFMLLSDHADELKSAGNYAKAQHLASACFSLWRAAFLADRQTKKAETLADAVAFLGKMLIDNAINYPQDRSTRNWTFNFYMSTATSMLLQLSRDWPDVAEVLNAKRKVPKGSTAPQRRWDRTHEAFEKAIDCLADALE